MIDNVGIAGVETVGPSGELWRDCDRPAIFFDRNRGYGLVERFVNAALFASNTSQLGQHTYQDSSVTIQGTETAGGKQLFTTPATDNAEGWHQPGANVGGSFRISVASPTKLWHEQMIELGQIIESGHLVGLAEKGCAIADMLADNTGALADKDFIGFHCPMHASQAVFSFVYRKAGQTMVTVQSAVHTAVAGTAVRLGLRRDLVKKKLFAYVNGVEAGSLYLPSATNFPDGDLLMPIRGIKNGAAAIKTFGHYWTETYAGF